MDRDRTPGALPAALAGVALWATNAYAADVALTGLSVFQLLTLQYGAAAAVMLVSRAGRAIRAGRARMPPTGTGAAPLLIGVIGLTGTVFLQYWAFATAPIVAANVIAYGWPLVASVWIAVTRRTRQAVLGAPLALVGFGGVALIFAADGLRFDGAIVGYLAALGSAAAMALYTVAAARTATSVTGLLLPASVIGTVIAAVATTVSARPWPPISAWLPAVYIGVGPMAAGYALWTYAMSRGGADRLSPIGYATPLLSTGILIATGRPFGTTTLFGAALILLCSVGVLVNDRQAAGGRRLPPPRRRSRNPGNARSGRRGRGGRRCWAGRNRGRSRPRCPWPPAR